MDCIPFITFMLDEYNICSYATTPSSLFDEEHIVIGGDVNSKVKPR